MESKTKKSKRDESPEPPKKKAVSRKKDLADRAPGPLPCLRFGTGVGGFGGSG